MYSLNWYFIKLVIYEIKFNKKYQKKLKLSFIWERFYKIVFWYLKNSIKSTKFLIEIKNIYRKFKMTLKSLLYVDFPNSQIPNIFNESNCTVSDIFKCFPLTLLLFLT